MYRLRFLPRLAGARMHEMLTTRGVHRHGDSVLVPAIDIEMRHHAVIYFQNLIRRACPAGRARHGWRLSSDTSWSLFHQSQAAAAWRLIS